jgi:hypothetical protein
MPEERIKVLTGTMFGRVVLIVRRVVGNFTCRPQMVLSRHEPALSASRPWRSSR